MTPDHSARLQAAAEKVPTWSGPDLGYALAIAGIDPATAVYIAACDPAAILCLIKEFGQRPTSSELVAMTVRAVSAERQAEVSTAAAEHTADLLQSLTAGYLEAIREAETQRARAEHAEAALRSIVALAPPPMPSPALHELRYGAAFDQASAAVAGREMGRQDAAEIAREALTQSGNSTR